MTKLLKLAAAAVVMLLPLAGQAKTPGDIADLVGARGSSFDGEMEQRGYSYIKNVGLAQFWWNSNSDTCVSAATDDGRISSIQSTASGDCGKSGGKSGDNSALVGVAVGAAAVGLVAALASHHDKHKHKDKDNNSNNNAKYNGEYEHGYNDALYGGHYADDDSEAYHSGYMAGEAERNNRRHANSALVRGAPAAAQNACAARGDRNWRVPAGSTVPVSVQDYGQGNYEVTVASGHRRANCSVSAKGDISDFLPL